MLVAPERSTAGIYPCPVLPVRWRLILLLLVTQTPQAADYSMLISPPWKCPKLMQTTPESITGREVLSQLISKPILPAQAGMKPVQWLPGRSSPHWSCSPSWIQPRPANCQWAQSTRPSPSALTYLLAKKATQGKRRSCVSTKTFCTKRFGLQLCCKGTRDKH